MKRFAVLAAAFFAFSGPLRADDGQFIRVDEDAKAARLQTAVTRFEKDGVKVDLIGAVHIGDRNVRCLEVLDRELAAGRKNVGIFYGAAHYPDMQKRLIEQGFTRTNHEWVTAWNVLKPIKKVSAP